MAVGAERDAKRGSSIATAARVRKKEQKAVKTEISRLSIAMRA
jgi:hypothetical protein